MPDRERLIDDLVNTFIAGAREARFALLSTFVAGVIDVAKQAALEALVDLDGAPELPPKPRENSARASGKRPTTHDGGRRSPRKIEALQRRILAIIEANPGQRVGYIANALHVSTKELALPVSHLVAATKVRTKGQRSGTTYYLPASRANAPRAKARAKASRAKARAKAPRAKRRRAKAS